MAYRSRVIWTANVFISSSFFHSTVKEVHSKFIMATVQQLSLKCTSDISKCPKMNKICFTDFTKRVLGKLLW